jgi:hypothetical protein
VYCQSGRIVAVFECFSLWSKLLGVNLVVLIGSLSHLELKDAKSQCANDQTKESGLHGFFVHAQQGGFSLDDGGS